MIGHGFKNQRQILLRFCSTINNSANIDSLFSNETCVWTNDAYNSFSVRRIIRTCFYVTHRTDRLGHE